MTQSPLFKRAFVRGLNAHLMREGVVLYPSKEAADATADYIADQSGMPDPVTQRDHLNVKVAEALVGMLMQGAETQCQRAGNQYSPNLTKTAAAVDPVALAQHDAQAIMEKAASENGDNTLTNATRYDELAQIDAENRPEGYANSGRGNYEGKGEAPVGREGEPSAPGTDTNRKVPGSNSAIESSKSASLQQIVRRVQKTAEEDIGDAGPNDMPNAAKRDPLAKMEQKERPENYANHGESQGITTFNIPASAQTGEEKPHPDAEGVEVPDTNSVTEMVGGKTGGAKTAFDILFERTARQVVPYLPRQLSDDVKVAHVRNMLGLDARGRADYLGRFYVQSGMQQKLAQSYRSQFLKQAAEEEENADGSKEKKPAGEVADRPAEEQEGHSEGEKHDIPAQFQKKESSLNTLRSRLMGLA